VLLLYTEEQLHRAYKVYLRDYCIAEAMPDLATFRSMFEENEKIQQLADREINEH
jgi:hypothetical protein